MKTTPKKIHFHHQDHQGHQEQSDIKQWAKLGVLGGLNGCFDVFPFRTLRESELTPARQKETFAATRQSPATGVNEFTKTTKMENESKAYLSLVNLVTLVVQTSAFVFVLKGEVARG